MYLKKQLTIVILSLCCLLLSAEEIEKVLIEGNQRVSAETFKFYIKSREGQEFSEERLLRDFQSLWQTGFFADIKIDLTNGQTGKIIKFIVQENPLIVEVEFKVKKGVKEADIKSKLQEANLSVVQFSYLNQAKLKKAEKVIYEFLRSKGFENANVKIEVTDLTNGKKVALEIVILNFPGLKRAIFRRDF